MSFVAGAITGNLLLDTSGFTGGISAAISAATAGAPGISGPILIALDLIKASASAAFSFIKQTIAEVGGRFDDMGEAAEKAGVSTEFLSRVGLAAADAGASVEGVGDSMKFLNKNLSEAAAGGSEELIAAFQKVGISQDELAGLSGNTEAAFARLVDGFQGIESPADKTSVAMALLGRSGTELIPTLNLGADGLKKFADISDQVGNTVTADQAKAGDAFGTLGTVINAAWTGVKSAFATPILKAFGSEAGNIEGVVGKIAQVISTVIPPALTIAASIAKVVLGIVQAILSVLEPVAVFADKISSLLTGKNVTFGQDIVKAGQSAVAAGQAIATNVQVNVAAGIDTKDATSQIAEKIRPELTRVADEQRSSLEGSARRAMVADSIGGRAS